MKKAIIITLLAISCIGVAKANKSRYFFSIYISDKSDSLVYCCNKLTPINQLKDLLKEYISNDEGYTIDADGIGQLKQSLAVIALHTSRRAKYKTYFAVQNEISRAYNELRNELALKLWSYQYNQLEPHQQNIICKAYPILVSDAEPHRHRPAINKF